MGLDNINVWELMLIVLVGLFIFGPDRLPKAIGDGLKMLRSLRQMARNATSDLSRELGTQVELEDLHPKTFLRKHLLSEADEQALRKPLQDAYDDLRGVAGSVSEATEGAIDPSPAPASNSGGTSVARRYDDDAT